MKPLQGAYWQESACSAAAAVRMLDRRVCPPDQDGGQMKNLDDASEFLPYLWKRKRAHRRYLSLYGPTKQVSAI